MKKLKVLLLLFLFITIGVNAYVIESPPFYPNANVTSTKDCVHASIHEHTLTGNIVVPILKISSDCSEKYIYYINNSKNVLIKSWSEDGKWGDAMKFKNDLYITNKIHDSNILNRFLNLEEHKQDNYGVFSRTLVNYNNEKDFFTIKGQVYYDLSQNKIIELDKINKKCIDVQIKEEKNSKNSYDLIITSNCKEKYLYYDGYDTEQTLLVNDYDFINNDWWKKLKAYLDDRYTFSFSPEIRDDTIVTEGLFEKKLVNFDNEDDIVLIKGDINNKINIVEKRGNSYEINFKNIGIILLVLLMIFILLRYKIYREYIKK